MSPWLWLLLPVLVTAASWLVVTWRGRPRGPGEPVETITEHERFRAALAAGAAPAREAHAVTVQPGSPGGRATDR